MGNVLVANGIFDVSGTSGNDVFIPHNKDVYFISEDRTISGGAGDDYYFVSSNTKVYEKPGEGVDIVNTNTNYKLSDNIEGLWFGGSTGIGNDIGNTICGTASSQLINGGKGDDYLIGGGGADIYQFDAHSGRDTIADWNAQSAVRIGGYVQFQSLSDVTKAMTQVAGDVVLKFDADNDLTIKNAKIADFTASNFQYRIDLSKLHLSFDDEFNNFSVKQPSQGKNGVWSLWGHDSDKLSDHTLLGNGEKQLYVDPLFKGTGKTALGLNPYSIQDGVLNITASPIAADKQAALYNYKFQSGAISSDQTFSQTYGYFEARLQLPSEKGTWPAFWLMRKDGVWPPELDIMEAWNDTAAVQTVHSQQHGFHETNSARTWLPDGDTAFHDYGFLWTAEKITWFLDGVEVFSQPTPADMNSPMYMIVNLAVSGQVQDPNFNETLKVDYVRAYSLENLPAGIAPVSPDPTVAVPTAATDAAHTYYGAVQGMPDGLNSAYYLAHNPDVAAAFGNDALTHYLRYGRAEGRTAFDSSAVAAPTTPVPTPVINTPAPTPPATPVVDHPAPTTPVVTTPVVTTPPVTTPVPTPPATTTPVATTPTTDNAYWGKIATAKDGFNAAYYASHNPDVVAVYGSGESALLSHYQNYGKKEGRAAYDATDVETATHHAFWGAVGTARDGFNAAYYASHNPDVVSVFGNDSGNLLYHFETFGKKEGRLAYEATAPVAAATSSVSTTAIADLHDVPASAFHTELHMVEPVALLGVASPDQHYGLAA